MELQLIMDLNSKPDEIIGMVPFRDKIIIATRSKLLVLEYHEEAGIMIEECVRRHHSELWPDI